jgi:hypothetical protein
MLYKHVYVCSRIKYGYSKDFDTRFKNYKTHVGDLILKTIKFPQQKDKIDELAIKEYMTRILKLTSVNGGEIFEDPGNLDIIDSDLTLETFYRHLKKIEFIPPGCNKLSGFLRKRLLSLYRIFDYPEEERINQNTIISVSNLIETYYPSINIEDNIFIKARVDNEFRDELIKENLTNRDLLDYWFKGEEI